MKVIDKRMFTPDGRLREGFEEEAAPTAGEGDAAPEESAPPPPAPAQGAGTVPRPVASPAEPGASPPRPPLELPGSPGLGAPTFFDLVGLLAEPISLYLGDLQLPEGGSAENLDLARLHIDLLALLRQKTAGNLTAQEAGILEDLLYRLRMRYIQKRG